ELPTDYKPNKKQYLEFKEKVSGTVTDAKTGEILAGVNVVIKGTSRGASTDAQGQVVVNALSLQDTLVISVNGYKKKVVPIGGRTTIDIILEPQILQGDELVVTGFGTQERRQVTGSIATVEAEEFVGGNIDDVSGLLRGKVAGLSMSTNGANPNDDPIIRLRGISSFGENQEPLVVVDGVPGVSMENVDPNDIKSINILKDASASAIYGTRGSAGVIVITTKSGMGEFSVSYKGSYTVETVANKLDVLNASEFKELAEITGFNANLLGHQTDWFGEISQSGANNIQSLSFSGGSEDMNYRISVNYRNRKGIQKKTGFERINGRLNLTQWALDSKLKFDLNLSINDKQSNNGFPESFRYAAIYNPTAPIRVGTDSLPTTGGFFEQPLFDYYNPANIIENGERRQESKLLSGNLKATYDFKEAVPGLQVSATYSLATENYINRNFYAKTHKFVGGATTSSLGPGLAEKGIDDSREQLFQGQINYDTNVSSFNFEGFVGYQWQNFEYSGAYVSGGDFVTDVVKYNNFDFAQDFDQGEGTVSSYKNTHKLIGFYARANLDWDRTYYFNVSARREGS